MEKTKQYTLKKGTVLDGRYEIEEVIGEGGFGITYKGVHKSIGMAVAIKEYFSKDIMDRDTSESDQVKLTWDENKKTFEKEKKRFLKEARIVSDFSKEDGVVHIMDYFEANNTVYIVMEYVEGVSLRDYIKENGTMSVDDVLRKMQPVIHTLDKIHECGVIHRDIGPNNIMVEKGGEFRLIDFGSAREFEDLDEKSYSIVLTGGYAPPEQYDKEGKLGPWTDVYAVCAVIYFAITGYSPQEALSRVLYDELEKPSERGVKIKSDVEKVILKGLSVNPKDRYQSMEELESEIKPFIEEKEKKGPRNKILIAGLVAAVVAIAVVGGIFGWNKYYESHKEQIIFGDEEIQHILMEGDEDISVKDYNEAQKVIEKRLEVLTDDKYLMEEKNGKIRIAIPNNIIGKEEYYNTHKTSQNINNFCDAYLARPFIPYLFSHNEYEEHKGEQGVKISYSDVQEINIKKGNGGIKKEDNENERDKLMANINEYYEIKLNKHCIDKLKEAKITNNVDIVYDTSLDSASYQELGHLDYSKSVLCIRCDVKSQNIRDLFKYNWTNPGFSGSLSTVTYDCPIKWENPNSSLVKGEKQVAEDKIDNPSVTYLYRDNSYSDDITEGQFSSTVTDFKKRMDSLGVDYATGTDKNCQDKNIVIKVAQKDVNTYIMGKAITENSAQISLCSNMRKDDFYGDRSYKLSEKNGKKVLTISYEDNYKKDLEKFTKNVIADKDNEVYIRIGIYDIAKAKIKGVIKNGKLVFDDYLVKNDKVPYVYYSFIEAALNKTTMDRTFECYHAFCLDKNSKLEDGRNKELNNLTSNSKERYNKDVKKILDISDNLKPWDFDVDQTENEIMIDFKEIDRSEESLKEAFNMMKKVVKECDLLDGNYDEICFRLPNKDNKTSSLVQLRKNTDKGRYEKSVYLGQSYEEKSYDKQQLKSLFDKYFSNLKWDEYSD